VGDLPARRPHQRPASQDQRHHRSAAALIALACVLSACGDSPDRSTDLERALPGPLAEDAPPASGGTPVKRVACEREGDGYGCRVTFDLLALPDPEPRYRVTLENGCWHARAQDPGGYAALYPASASGCLP
jgi:hypothetical protein